MTGWDDKQTAQAYDKYSKHYPIYRDTSRDLVNLAKIESDMHVIDLCGGTGVTSQAVLNVLKASGHLHLVDMSSAMLDIARQNLQANNLSFHQASAEALHEIIAQPADRVICNSAFWQVDMDAVLKAIHEVIKPDGMFAFNLPSGFYEIPNEKDMREQGVNFRAMMRKIAEDEYGYNFPPRIHTWQLDYDHVCRKLTDNGFGLSNYQVVNYQQSYAASREFFAIPVMTERNLPGVDYNTRCEILDKICASLNLEETFTVSWAYFVTTVAS
jgi:ubiquinone/menaquinone biosynthesis C-methylase UbiE